MQVISILDKNHFSGLSLVYLWLPAVQTVFPVTGTEAPHLDWTRLSRLVLAACQLGGRKVFPGQLTLSDLLNTVLLMGSQIIPDAGKDPVGPLPQTISHTPYLVSSNHKHVSLFLTPDGLAS